MLPLTCEATHYYSRDALSLLLSCCPTSEATHYYLLDALRLPLKCKAFQSTPSIGPGVQLQEARHLVKRFPCQASVKHVASLLVDT